MNSIDEMAVAERLQRIREFHDLSQGAFADSVNIDRSSYSKIEKGTKPLKAEMAYAIAEKWGVSMDFIYRGRLTELPRTMADAFMANRTSGN
ncbi:MAG TPA: XRE family transcriptional regulator [Alphaproteobacteria bacterium]|nr:XRE family transcriptional regulator [Alphaproteobacteria bacterium]